LYDVFQLFDYTDASTVNGNRATSTVAPQALYLLNAEFVRESATKLAARLLKDSREESERIRMLYQLSLGRLPTPKEMRRTPIYLSQFREAINDKENGESEAWATLCQVLLISNEFVTIR
jgi:hypothetical protein